MDVTALLQSLLMAAAMLGVQWLSNFNNSEQRRRDAENARRMKREELAAARNMKRLELAYGQRATAYREYIREAGHFVHMGVGMSGSQLERAYGEYLISWGAVRICASDDVRRQLDQAHTMIMEFRGDIGGGGNVLTAQSVVSKFSTQMNELTEAMSRDLGDAARAHLTG